jgi:hypothetical protein
MNKTLLIGMMMLLLLTSVAVAQEPATDGWRFNTTLMEFDSTLSAGISLTTKGLFFTSDGINAYTVDRFYNVARIVNMTTAWDISTGTVTDTFNVGGESGYSTGIHLSSDYTKMYITDSSPDQIIEYHLTTPRDISTATYNQTLITSYNPDDIHFNPEGTKMYILHSSSNSVIEFNLSTAWNINTSVFHQSRNIILDVGTSNAAQGLAFSAEGHYMFVNLQTRLYRWQLSTPWDISTATLLEQKSLTSIPDANQAYSVFVSTYGDKIFTTDNDGIIIEYIIPAPNWTCSAYETCVNPMAIANCINVTDLNNRGYTYTGDYTEFTPQACYYGMSGSSGGSTSGILINAETGEEVGYMTNKTAYLNPTTKTTTTPLLSIGGNGEKFDIDTWFSNLIADIKGWLIK